MKISFFAGIYLPVISDKPLPSHQSSLTAYSLKLLNQLTELPPPDQSKNAMAPSATEKDSADKATASKALLELPGPALARMTKAGIDLSNGYPWLPVSKEPVYWQDISKLRTEQWKHNDPAARADKSKSALFSAATKVTDITTHIGTEIEGLQLKDLTDKQRDELALLIAERSVVVLREQDLSPQQQLELGRYYGVVDVHVSRHPLKSLAT